MNLDFTQDMNVLIVDDEEFVLKSISRTLKTELYKVFTASSGKEALTMIKEEKINVVITDEYMPEMRGTELLNTIKTAYPTIIRILITGNASIDTAMEAINNGEIYRFLLKPSDNRELILCVRSALEKFYLENEREMLLNSLKEQLIELKVIEKVYPEYKDETRDNKGEINKQILTEEEIEVLYKEFNSKYIKE